MHSSYSIVIPCYNVREYVGEAVASALAQTHAPQEVLCVDDGSTDGTLEVLERLRDANRETLRVLTGPNAGACVARNKGLSEARGEWVQFLDADDLLEPEKVERQLTESVGEKGLVCGSYEHVTSGGTHVKRSGGYADDWANLVTKQCGITSANLWRRSAVQRAGGWNPAWKSSQEYELMFRLLKSGAGVAYSSDVLTTLRAREGSISYDFDAATRSRYLELRAQVVEHLEGRGELTGERRDVILEEVFSLIRGLYRLDPARAMAFHKRLVPKGYVPPVSPANGRMFVRVYRLLGLRGAELVRASMGKA